MFTVFESQEQKQERMNAQVKVMRREGKILDRFDKEIEQGFRTGMFIEWQGYEYLVRMLNGNVTHIKELWKIAE